MNTLYLLPEEKKLFDALSEELKQGWEVEEDVIEYQDTPEKRTFRFKHVHVSDPALVEFIEKAKAAGSEPDAIRMILELDLTEVSPEDLQELFYAAGPDALGNALGTMLQVAEASEDIEQVGAYSTMRHLLFAPLPK